MSSGDLRLLTRILGTLTLPNERKSRIQSLQAVFARILRRIGHSIRRYPHLRDDAIRPATRPTDSIEFQMFKNSKEFRAQRLVPQTAASEQPPKPRIRLQRIPTFAEDLGTCCIYELYETAYETRNDESHKSPTCHTAPTTRSPTRHS